MIIKYKLSNTNENIKKKKQHKWTNSFLNTILHKKTIQMKVYKKQREHYLSNYRISMIIYCVSIEK